MSDQFPQWSQIFLDNDKEVQFLMIKDNLQLNLRAICTFLIYTITLIGASFTAYNISLMYKNH